MARVQTTVSLLVEDEQRLRRLAEISERDRRSLGSFALRYLEHRLNQDPAFVDSLSDLLRLPGSTKHISFTPTPDMQRLLDELRGRILSMNDQTFMWPVLLRAAYTLWLHDHPEDETLLDVVGAPIMSTA